MSGAWHVVFGDSAKAQEVGSSNGGALSSEATVKLVIQFGACAEFQSIGIRKGGVGGKAGRVAPMKDDTEAGRSLLQDS